MSFYQGPKTGINSAWLNIPGANSPEGNNSVRFNGDGDKVLVAYRDGTVRLWNAYPLAPDRVVERARRVYIFGGEGGVRTHVGR
jgi:hypothetical protein